MVDELGPHPVEQAMLRLLPKGEVFAQLRQDLFDREQKRAEQLRDVVAETVSMADLLSQIAADERIGEMFRSAVDAAMRSTSDLKIRLLGRALSQGALADDDAKVDEAEQLLRVATELDTVDLRALMVIREDQTRFRPQSNPFQSLRRLGLSSASAWPVLARLQRLGLMSTSQRASVSTFDEDRENDDIEVQEEWSLTPAATEVLKLLGVRNTHGGTRFDVSAQPEGRTLFD